MNDFDKYIAQIYRDMELYLIDSMQRNLARHIAEERKTGFKYPQWQAQKLKELKRYQRQNKKIIDSYTKGLSKEIAQHMKAELSQGSLSQIKLFKEALKSGYRSTVLMKDSFFKVNDNKVTALINALQNDLDTANTAVLRMMNDTYRETIFRAGMFSSNGVLTETQAYDMAVKDFLDRGINCIVYKDGRRVNIADYASMAVRTASQRAYMVGEGEFRKEIGETLVIVSRHNGTCEYCAPFENKVLIDDVYSGGSADDGDYMLLSEAMKLGLYHPRCRHGINTFYPELEEINHYDNEKNRVNEYGSEEINRAHVENMVQKYKRLSSGSIDPENVAEYRAKLKEWQGKKARLGIAKSEKSDIIKSGSEKMAINSIELPIEQRNTGKGNPNAVLIFGVELNNRQKILIDKLPEFNSKTIVKKETVSMSDLATLTAQTGDEFAMFTKGNERLIIRGNKQMVDIDVVAAQRLASEGYRWSGHTHPGLNFNCMQPSDGDYAILMCFNQKNAVIYNSKGDFRTFEKRSE